MGEAMISPDEFLRRCEQVRAEFAVEVTKRQQLTRELAALCALTGARAESVCDQNSQLTGLRVSDPGGNLVISGPVDQVLAELVAVPVSYQNRGPNPSARHRTRSSETAVQPPDQLVAAPPSYQNRGPSPSPSHQPRSSETAARPADPLVAGKTVPDAVRLDLVGVDESGRARGRWPSRVLSRGHNGGTGGGRPGAWSTGALGGHGARSRGSAAWGAQMELRAIQKRNRDETVRARNAGEPKQRPSYGYMYVTVVAAWSAVPPPRSRQRHLPAPTPRPRPGAELSTQGF